MGRFLPLLPKGLGAVLPLLLALGLGGCSNTPLGQQLGNSFGPTPESAPGAAAKPLEKQRPAEQPKPTPEAKPAGQQKPGQQKQVEQPKTVLEPKPMAETKPVTPVPYRVVLRLPMADPSAPAEALTRALRAANLPFEVETIERVSPAAQAQAQSPSPSPGPTPAHGR